MQLEINKKTQIAWIVETRKPLIDQISLKQQYLLHMSDAVRALEALQEPILQSEEAALIELMKEIDLPAIRRGIQKQRRALENIKKRFTRATINIGVIGRARQGKSRVLQSLSGLSADVIPDGELGACTGVRSIVSHSPNESYADVYFYTNDELMQTVIVPYYRELALHPVPTSIDQFASSVLPPLSQDLQKQVTASAKYGHLKKYHDHINEYRPLLYVSLPQRIQLNDVRQYVAQQTHEGQDIYNHFAVREVKIYCPFPYARDVEQLAFIDLPGLGDTGMGDEERIIKALGEDIDIALLIRKPVPGGDLWSDFDTDLYDKAQCALQDLLPERTILVTITTRMVLLLSVPGVHFVFMFGDKPTSRQHNIAEVFKFPVAFHLPYFLDISAQASSVAWACCSARTLFVFLSQAIEFVGTQVPEQWPVLRKSHRCYTSF